MLDQTANNHPRGNILIFNVWLALCILGLIMVTSVSVDFARESEQSMWYFSIRHSFNLGISLVFLLIAWMTPLSFWQRYHKLLFVLGLAMLVALLVPQISFVDDQQRRWIGNSHMAWQPAELFKFLFVVYVAALMARKGESLADNHLSLLHVFLIAQVPVLLLLVQFDYASALVISITLLLLLFVCGLPLLRWLSVVVLAAVIGCGVWFANTGFAVDSLSNYIDMSEELVLLPEPETKEAIVALGSDGWLGLGLGRSTQKMAYLSEAHTNYIFAVLSEELGFITAMIVVLLFVLLMLRGSILGWRYLREKETFSGLLLTGVTLLLVLPELFNIGINLGLLPSFNSSLPFISYGGNHLIISSLLIGVLLSGESEYSQRIR